MKEGFNKFSTNWLCQNKQNNSFIIRNFLVVQARSSWLVLTWHCRLLFVSPFMVFVSSFYFLALFGRAGILFPVQFSFCIVDLSVQVFLRCYCKFVVLMLWSWGDYLKSIPCVTVWHWKTNFFVYWYLLKSFYSLFLFHFLMLKYPWGKL